MLFLLIAEFLCQFVVETLLCDAIFFVVPILSKDKFILESLIRLEQNSDAPFSTTIMLKLLNA